jgi:hypothetical protein
MQNSTTTDPVKVKLTRDSVCAADDCDAPHEESIEAFPFSDPLAFVKQFAPSYVPGIAGFGHSWTVIFNGEPIVSITTTTIEPKVSKIQFEAENAAHFKYLSAPF